MKGIWKRCAALIGALAVVFAGLFSGNVETCAANVQITDVVATEQSSNGYKVTVSILSPNNVSKVLMPTWSDANGQDDLVWHQATVSGGTAVFYVPTSAHKGETGSYTTHVYVYDKNGNYDLRGIHVSVPSKNGTATAAPAIQKIDISELTSAGYRVTAAFTAGAGVESVQMPTWTAANGQDDLVWHKASVSGNKATFYVSAADHKKEAGTYTTHVYVYDRQGRLAIAGTNVTVPPATAAAPAIQKVDVSELTSNGYRVTATFTAPAGVDKVLMPAWTTANGQDDVAWHKASVNGNKATFYISTADHKNETGAYTTHVYVYDKQGRSAIAGTSVAVPAPQAARVLRIDHVTVDQVSPAGYRVSVDFTATAGVDRVLMPTWTTANGQDDMVWHQAAVNGNKATYTVQVKDHKNESGTYQTHVYVYDKTGAYVIMGTDASVPSGPNTKELKITNVQISDVSSEGYKVTATVQSSEPLTQVQMPTWTTAKGQDDLVWHQAQISGSQATFYVPASQHRYESGNYVTHVYVRTAGGQAGPVAVTVDLPARDNPAFIGYVVCIDAGHQEYGIPQMEPNGPGSTVMKAKLTSGTSGVASGVAEHALNLAVALQLKQELINRGYSVVMIRETSSCTLSNAERAVVANNSRADVFLRIHANSSANASITGALTYAPALDNPYMSAEVINKSNVLSTVILSRFCEATGAVSRGILQDNTMTGLNWSKVPVTIIEMGFMSNPSEDLLMQTPAYQARMVQGLANGIDAFFGISR